MAKEIDSLAASAPPGIAAWPLEDDGDSSQCLYELEAEITGATDTPYAGGGFRLRVTIPQDYPVKPPAVRFVTKIYHPNIDTQGRICLDTLNMPPKGAWKPSLNILTVLASIQLLMSHPNADDGLMADITDEYKRFPARFEATAREWTIKYARSDLMNEAEKEEKQKRDTGGGLTEPAASTGCTSEDVPRRTNNEFTDYDSTEAKYSSKVYPGSSQAAINTHENELGCKSESPGSVSSNIESSPTNFENAGATPQPTIDRVEAESTRESCSGLQLCSTVRDVVGPGQVSKDLPTLLHSAPHCQPHSTGKKQARVPGTDVIDLNCDDSSESEKATSSRLKRRRR